MALKVKAIEKNIKFTKNDNDPGVWRYVMQPELYIALSQEKVIKEAALRSGVSKGVMRAFQLSGILVGYFTMISLSVSISPEPFLCLFICSTSPSRQISPEPVNWQSTLLHPLPK